MFHPPADYNNYQNDITKCLVEELLLWHIFFNTQTNLGSTTFLGTESTCRSLEVWHIVSYLYFTHLTSVTAWDCKRNIFSSSYALFICEIRYKKTQGSEDVETPLILMCTWSLRSLRWLTHRTLRWRNWSGCTN